MQYIQDLGSKVCFASVAHRRSNGQAERANAEVLRGLKTRTFNRLHKCRRRWIDELPTVLWRSGQHQIEPLARHLLPWCTGQKQFSPRNSYTGHLECSLMLSLSKSSYAKMMRSSLRKIIFGLLCESLATSKPCAATIAARFIPEALRKATLFFGESNPPRISTS